MATESRALDVDLREAEQRLANAKAEQVRFEERHQARLRALDAMRIVSAAVGSYPAGSPEVVALTAVFHVLEARVERDLEQEAADA